MAIKKNYRELARDLKKLGLIDYDLRKELSTGQKSRITALAAEYKHVIKHPEAFHKPLVSKETARQLRDSGFKVTKGGRALIPLHRYDSARIKGGTITYSYRENGNTITEKTVLAGAKEFHRELEKVSRSKLKRNQMITAQIGQSSAFNTRFRNYADLYRYLHHDFKPKDPGETLQNLLGKISIVTVTKEKKNAPKEKGTPVKTGKRNRRH